ncbi:hypothetical protein DB346_23485 [Verrucomicrobia bacterium LW23]|nr:hypothetical protein DB346_23485 [Verrucomicrobia bacterium LW23]
MPSTTVPQVDTETVQLLLEAGYTAVGVGLTDRADAIFAGLRVLRPESDAPLIGKAVSLISSGKYAEAVKVLENEALAVVPGSPLARAFIGMALQLQGLGSQARETLEAVVAEDSDPSATSLARNLLESNG